MRELEQIKEDIEKVENGEYGGNLDFAYSALRGIVKAQPKLASEVLEVVNTGLQSDKNDHYSLGFAYRALGDVVQAQPELAPEVFKTFNTVLKHKNNDGDSLYSAFDTLRDITEVQPELASEVLNLVNTGLQNKENTGYNDGDYEGSLSLAYRTLGDITKVQPELAPEVLKTFNMALHHDNNSRDSFDTAYEVLRDVVKAQPELAPEVLKTFNMALQQENNHRNSGFSNSFEVFRTSDGGIEAGYIKTNANDHGAYMTSEGEIQLLHMRLSQERGSALQHEDYNRDSLVTVYSALGDIVKTQPELAPEVLEMVNTGLQSDRNNSASLSSAYDVLGDVVKAQPELVSNIKNVVRGMPVSVERTKLLSTCLEYQKGVVSLQASEKTPSSKSERGSSQQNRVVTPTLPKRGRVE